MPMPSSARYRSRPRLDMIVATSAPPAKRPRPGEPQPFREALLNRLDVAATSVVEPLGATEFSRRGPARRTAFERFLDLGFEIVRQFVAVTAEELDAVVVVGIVRGG